MAVAADINGIAAETTDNNNREEKDEEDPRHSAELWIYLPLECKASNYSLKKTKRMACWE